MRETKKADMLDREALESKAEDIYHETMCGAAGCCGNFYGAIEFLLNEFDKVLDSKPAAE
jgi:hypothetical protein